MSSVAKMGKYGDQDPNKLLVSQRWASSGHLEVTGDTGPYVGAVPTKGTRLLPRALARAVTWATPSLDVREACGGGPPLPKDSTGTAMHLPPS